MQAVGNRIILTLKKKEKQEGGLIIPDSAKKDDQIFVIIFLGEGKRDLAGNLIPSELETMQEVIVDPYAVKHFPYRGNDYFTCKFDDIIAVVG